MDQNENKSNPELPAGVPEGTVLGEEKIVHDRDENGNVIGWHKEAVNG